MQFQFASARDIVFDFFTKFLRTLFSLLSIRRQNPAESTQIRKKKLRGTYFQNQNNPRADYAVCNFDIRHIYNATVVAQSPFKGVGLRNPLLGGWQFSSTIRATSGWPIDIRTGTDTSLTGKGNDRPNLVAGQPLDVKQWQSCGSNWCDQWFNPAAFVAPTAAPGTFGNISRDFLYAPGVINFDAAITCRFKIHEEKEFEFRFEAFNAINHFNPSIGVPGTTAPINSANFGRQTAASTPAFVPSIYDPRILQFGAKLYFWASGRQVRAPS